ncbi:MAG: M20/M25/M40 family metallo-hydrolase [Halobacteriaceae archaeon]
MSLADDQREFLDSLLETPSPSGYESRGQRVWLDYVAQFADAVETDAYGNAVATYRGDSGPELLFGGHGDEIGFIVTDVDDDGFVTVSPIGGSDKTVMAGQHVTVHAADGPVHGVVGQTAIHLRSDNEVQDITDRHIDLGVEDGEEAEALVEVGDPVTFSTTTRELQGTRLAARGMDNRVGTWAAAEALRRAADAGVEATVHAVSTVQEEVGRNGAEMVAFDIDPDAAVAVDVSHAVDDPGSPGGGQADIELGGGPVVGRGNANHPQVVSAVRAAAADADVDVQLDAHGSDTGTDANAFYTQRGGIPSLNVGVPNRYMHTPVEVIDTDDLDDVADLLAAFAEHAGDTDSFAVDV